MPISRYIVSNNKLLIITTLVLNLIISFPIISKAESTKYTQRILPIDCLYEVIDAGSQTLRFLTPDTCPIEPQDPIITNPPGETIFESSDNRIAVSSRNIIIAIPQKDSNNIINIPSTQGAVFGLAEPAKPFNPKYRQTEIFEYYIIGATVLFLLAFGAFLYKKKKIKR
ncbi:MAG: hypothetical protein MUF85_01740 [Patescibacteria group bacterium]|jgi:hypothetical protein|nr:hypothetical protein [Patescibacteria group bacterium]